VTTEIKRYLQRDFPVRLDAPDRVSLFAYDNGTFVVQSFRDDDTAVNLSLLGEGVRLRDLSSGKLVEAQARRRQGRRLAPPGRARPHRVRRGHRAAQLRRLSNREIDACDLSRRGSSRQG
jgi:hypothetical protein